VIIALLAITSYAGRLSGTLDELPRDTFFRYSTAILAVAVDGILLAIVVLISRGLSFRHTFALRRPASWKQAAFIGAATLLGAYALSFTVVGLFPGLHREQSVPEFWDPARLRPWLANLFVIALFVPVFEEALCRGLGYALLEPFGPAAAILVTAIAFTLAHGVVIDIPVILTTGLGLGYLRAASGSLFPCIALHAVFNGFGLVAASLISNG
jgi:membrane protease YdiL (CAAX protease family)